MVFIGSAPPGSMRAVGDERAALALGAEAEVLEEQDRRDREGVVELGARRTSAGPSPASANARGAGLRGARSRSGRASTETWRWRVRLAAPSTSTGGRRSVARALGGRDDDRARRRRSPGSSRARQRVADHRRGRARPRRSAASRDQAPRVAAAPSAARRPRPRRAARASCRTRACGARRPARTRSTGIGGRYGASHGSSSCTDALPRPTSAASSRRRSARPRTGPAAIAARAWSSVEHRATSRRPSWRRCSAGAIAELLAEVQRAPSAAASSRRRGRRRRPTRSPRPPARAATPGPSGRSASSPGGASPRSDSAAPAIATARAGRHALTRRPRRPGAGAGRPRRQAHAHAQRRCATSSGATPDDAAHHPEALVEVDEHDARGGSPRACGRPSPRGPSPRPALRRPGQRRAASRAARAAAGQTRGPVGRALDRPGGPRATPRRGRGGEGARCGRAGAQPAGP